MFSSTEQIRIGLVVVYNSLDNVYWMGLGLNRYLVNDPKLCYSVIAFLGDVKESKGVGGRKKENQSRDKGRTVWRWKSNTPLYSRPKVSSTTLRRSVWVSVPPKSRGTPFEIGHFLFFSFNPLLVFLFRRKKTDVTWRDSNKEEQLNDFFRSLRKMWTT